MIVSCIGTFFYFVNREKCQSLKQFSDARTPNLNHFEYGFLGSLHYLVLLSFEKTTYKTMTLIIMMQLSVTKFMISS